MNSGSSMPVSSAALKEGWSWVRRSLFNQTILISGAATGKNYRLLILFPLMLRWRLHLNRLIAGLRFLRCLLLTPLLTRFRHNRKLLGFRCLLMMTITSFSRNPNWYSMASKGVRSSQAISIILLWSRSLKNCFMLSERIGREFVYGKKGA